MTEKGGCDRFVHDGTCMISCIYQCTGVDIYITQFLPHTTVVAGAGAVVQERLELSSLEILFIILRTRRRVGSPSNLFDIGAYLSSY
jgi:hypothetical protein